MALTTFKTKIENPATASIADTMNSIRSWLDRHRIQPVEFKSHTGKDGVIALEIAFKSEDEAHLFKRDFRAPDPDQIRV